MDETFGPKHDPRCNAVYDYANDCNCGLDLMRASDIPDKVVLVAALAANIGSDAAREALAAAQPYLRAQFYCVNQQAMDSLDFSDCDCDWCRTVDRLLEAERRIAELEDEVAFLKEDECAVKGCGKPATLGFVSSPARYEVYVCERHFDGETD